MASSNNMEICGNVVSCDAWLNVFELDDKMQLLRHFQLWDNHKVTEFGSFGVVLVLAMKYLSEAILLDQVTTEAYGKFRSDTGASPADCKIYLFSLLGKIIRLQPTQP
jgi:hypothetical protein